MKFDQVVAQILKPDLRVQLISSHASFSGIVREVGDGFIKLEAKEGMVYLNSADFDLQAMVLLNRQRRRKK